MSNINYDNKRTPFFASQDYKAVRFWNNEILTQINCALETLTLTLSHKEREQNRVLD